MREPNIVDGLRNPLSTKPELDRGQQEIDPEVVDVVRARQPKKVEGEKVTYVSKKARELMITVAIEDDIIIGQKKVRGRNKHIRFKNFQFTTSNPEVIEWMESQPFYGIDKDVCRLSDRMDLLLATNFKRAAAEMRQFDGQIDRLKPLLSAEDFDLADKVTKTIETQKQAQNL